MITMGIRQTTGLLAALAALVNLPIREDKISVGDRSEFASDGCRAALIPAVAMPLLIRPDEVSCGIFDVRVLEETLNPLW